FLFNRGTSAFTQATNTRTTNNAFPIFNSNPNIAGSGSLFTVAFYSNANLVGSNDDGGGRGNEEIYTATYNGAAIVSGSVRQVTKTKDPVDAQGISLKPTNRFTFGRRMSRDGRYIGLESMATDPKANATSALDFRVTFVYDAVSDTFAQLGPRP